MEAAAPRKGRMSAGKALALAAPDWSGSDWGLSRRSTVCSKLD